MSNLRAQIIKLAQQKPELRQHLVPLLRQAATNPDWLRDALQDLSKDYSNTRSALKPINHAIANGKPLTSDMIKTIQEAVKDDLKDIQEDGYVSNGHKAGRALFDKIQAWAKKAKVASVRQAGCEKLPEGGMRDNCEKKVEEGKGKTAGYSFAEDTAWFAFVGNKTPFNVDVIERINYTPLKFRDDDGQMQEDLGMRVSQSISYSPSLSYAQEKAGAVREVVFSIKYPRGSLRQVQAALTAIGKALKFQVEYLPSPRKAVTRQKSR